MENWRAQAMVLLREALETARREGRRVSVVEAWAEARAKAKAVAEASR